MHIASSVSRLYSSLRHFPTRWIWYRTSAFSYSVDLILDFGIFLLGGLGFGLRHFLAFMRIVTDEVMAYVDCQCWSCNGIIGLTRSNCKSMTGRADE
ncbi:hypothetical protein EJ06DRAFT_95316 [Trichodelitschia bisporula]|uniref:Uncharacterized protein n=1 Tax=Trichodelitschia bisporula TaxID=703511 RepID=A0A6G1HSV7_9PEZI|nr:hypothetical protein EJ06DRAFT_95316 [Trichodelitschia bisporula]